MPTSLAIDVEALRAAASRRRAANRPSLLLGLYLTRTLPGRKRPRVAAWLRRVFGLTG